MEFDKKKELMDLAKQDFYAMILPEIFMMGLLVLVFLSDILFR